MDTRRSSGNHSPRISEAPRMIRKSWILLKFPSTHFSKCSSHEKRRSEVHASISMKWSPRRWVSLNWMAPNCYSQSTTIKSLKNPGQTGEGRRRMSQRLFIARVTDCQAGGWDNCSSGMDAGHLVLYLGVVYGQNFSFSLYLNKPQQHKNQRSDVCSHTKHYMDT